MELKNGLKNDTELLQKIAVVAVFPLLVSPLIQFVRNCLWPERSFGLFGQESTYPWTIELINAFAGAGIILLWIMFLYTIWRGSDSFKKAFIRMLPQSFFLLLVVWAVVASVIKGHTLYFTEGAPVLSESMMTFALYFAGYFFVGILLSQEKYRRIVVLTIIGGGTIIGILSLIDFFGVSLKPGFYDNKVSAVFYNSNHYAYYLTICILLAAVSFVYEKKLWLRCVLLCSFVCNTVVLIVNDTLGSFLAVLFALGGFVWLVASGKTTKAPEQRKRETKSAVVLLCGYLLITIIMSFFYNTIFRSLVVMVFDIGKILTDAEDKDRAGNSRFRIWRYTIQYIREEPIFGHGVDEIAMRLYKDSGFSRSHNEYLQYTAFWGIPGLLLYLLACGAVFVRGLKERFVQQPYVCAAFVAAAGYMASAFFGNTKYYVSPFFFIVLGIAASGATWSCVNKGKLLRNDEKKFKEMGK